MSRFLPLSLAASLTLASALVPAHAQAEPGDVIALDYVPGWQVSDGVEMGGIRIRLEPGWKTYWRAPGDAGIPPQFVWSGSDNLRAVRIHWPTPEVFDTDGMRTIGYTDEVILPVELFAKDPALPVAVQGEALLGVCKDICIPASVGFGTLSGGDAALGAAAITAALDARPQSATGARVTCTVAPISDGLRLTAEVTLPSKGRDEVAVIEVGRADVWVSEAETVRRGDVLEVQADLVPPNAAPFSLDRSKVRMTVLGQHGSADLIGCDAG